MAKPFKIVVIGGGIIGTSSALLILKTLPNVEVTLIAEKFSPFTTGDGSAGFWKPYLIGNVSPERLRFWCYKTYEFLQNIAKSPDAEHYGVGLLPCYDLSVSPMIEPPYSDVFLNWRPMNSKELSMFPKRYKYGTFMTSFYVECTKLLPIFLKEIGKRGGQIIKRRVESIAEVKAPWIKYAVMDEEFYILPNSEETICGGTHQEDDSNIEVDPADRKRIWEGCTELVPSLRNAKITREWVGLRPGRFEPRIEREQLMTEKGSIEVIHNYGHGGSGITVGWGCAHEVVQLLENVLNDINIRRLTSHL